MLTIASFNVNSLRARVSNVLTWLKSASPDVALLQEIKCTEETLPRLELEAAGYQVSVVGQKALHGVAVLTKDPHKVEHCTLPGDPTDEQARYLEATIERPEGKRLRVASIYLPNGNPVATDKFQYKLAWMARLKEHARVLLETEEPIVLGGDYNVAPADEDVFNVQIMSTDALCQPETRERYRELIYLGYTEAFRALHSGGHHYTFWDYQAGRWNKDEGLRIDHLLLSPQAADLLDSCEIDRNPRRQDKPSDHTPIWCKLAI